MLIVVVLALGLGLGGALAGAKKKHKRKGHAWGAKITLTHPSPTQFAGTVDSSLGACFQGRLVNLFYTDPNGNSALLSVQRTTGKGRYKINLTQAAYPGVYQAQAPKERVRARKAPQRCKQAVSGIRGL